MAEDNCVLPVVDDDAAMQLAVVEWFTLGVLNLTDYASTLAGFPFSANATLLVYDVDTNNYADITNYLVGHFGSGWCTILHSLFGCEVGGNTVSIPARCPGTCVWADNCPEACPFTVTNVKCFVPTSQNNYDCNKKYCDRSNLNDADYKVLNGTNGDCEDCAARCDAENNCTGFECNGDLGSNERCIGYYGKKCNNPDEALEIIRMTCVRKPAVTTTTAAESTTTAAESSSTTLFTAAALLFVMMY